MAFREISKSAGRPKIEGAVSVANYHGSSAIMRISEDIHRDMGSPAFVSIAVGEGKDSGRIKLLPRARKAGAARALKRFGRSAAFSLYVSTEAAGLPKALWGATTIPHSITDDGLVLDIRPLKKPVAVANAA